MEHYRRTTTYYLYARKSSESEDRQVQSIDDQLNRLKELARDRGLRIKDIFTESRSAKMPDNRPVFRDMLNRIEQGAADGILCWQINRLSRNPIDSGRINWMLQQGIITSIQTIDREYLTDDNVLLFSVESGMANQYIIDLRKNIRRGIEGKISRGWFPGQAPIGYINDRINRTITKDPERFQLVRKMWDLMLTGAYTPPAILAIANEQWGFKTLQHRRSGGTPLANSSIYKLFSNVFYTGLFDWRGQQYRGNHEPMITLDEYDRVQRLLGRKGRPRPKTRRFAFTGMIRCGECGAMQTAEEKTKFIRSSRMQKTYVYYHCTHRKQNITCNQRKTLTAHALEEQIAQEISKYTILPEFHDWAISNLRDDTRRREAEDARIKGMIEKSLKETEHELNNLTRMCYRGIIEEKFFEKERIIIENKLARLKEKRATTENLIDRQYTVIAHGISFARNAYKAFKNGTFEEKRSILESLGSNPTVTDKIFSIETSEWLIPLSEKYPALEAEYLALEPDKLPVTATENEPLADLRTRWWSIVQDVGNILAKTPADDIHIPSIPFEQDEQ